MIWFFLFACGVLPSAESNPSPPAATEDPAPRLELAPLDKAEPEPDPAPRAALDPATDAEPDDRPDPSAAPAPSGAAGPSDAILTAEDCDAVPPEPAPADGCITGTLSCGDEIVSHTEGGVQRFDSRFYEKQFCTPSITSDHDGGGERVYRLEVPDGDWQVHITLDTPCTDLDLAVMKWDHAGCPEPNSKVFQCEMARKDGTQRERVRVASRGGSRWLVLVEPNGTEQGPFGLRVECTPGL